MSAWQQSFDALKESLMIGPVLVAPNYDLEFMFFMNMVNTRIGVLLCQTGDDDSLHLVIFEKEVSILADIQHSIDPNL
ncbi:hypothetical protein JRQ81_000594 [Phrynocephalus forsythii]|uniref:Reverse transcriptase/retrotransposon-derived protein RNase H-like domain-containing protein n=1 Tax=Phrynocephalus forsythii TaxID=171643 RepID=A0A9Q0Y5L7_9SAUR|nr:hypothetical protein JRQ81_000594 [Phrynocephalus forsythii]